MPEVFMEIMTMEHEGLWIAEEMTDCDGRIFSSVS